MQEQEHYVDELIDNLRRSHSEENAERRQREDELKSRRTIALRHIGDAAIKFNEPEQVVIFRLKEAQKARISHAEALVELAARGDFVSQIGWWDIRSKKKQSLWKGYVKQTRVARRRFAGVVAGRVDNIDVNVREMTQGGFVAEVMGVLGVAVGRNENSAQDAIESGWMAYQTMAGGRTIEDLPKALEI